MYLIGHIHHSITQSRIDLDRCALYCSNKQVNHNLQFQRIRDINFESVA